MSGYGLFDKNDIPDAASKSDLIKILREKRHFNQMIKELRQVAAVNDFDIEDYIKFLDGMEKFGIVGTVMINHEGKRRFESMDAIMSMISYHHDNGYEFPDEILNLAQKSIDDLTEDEEIKLIEFVAYSFEIDFSAINFKKHENKKV